MSNNIGTLVIAPIRPQSTLDTFPVAISNEISGGLHTYSLLTDRNNEPSERRSVGMVAYVDQTDAFYYLKGGTSNANWAVFSGSGAASGSFLTLSDVPSSYVGYANDTVKVNPTETGLVFSKSLKGQFVCVTGTNIYTIINSRITSTDQPQVTLTIPSILGTIFALAVTDVISGQFTVLLSGIPDTTGYKLNWSVN